jgi:hypothetical protein
LFSAELDLFYAEFSKAMQLQAMSPQAKAA